jgi:hypothetical protein
LAVQASGQHDRQDLRDRNRRYRKARHQDIPKERLLPMIAAMSDARQRYSQTANYERWGRPRPHPFQLLLIEPILLRQWLAREAVIRAQGSLAKV